MARALALAAVLFLAAACGGAETVTTVATETATVTATTTQTETVVASALPAPVAETHAALLEAAQSGDYEALRPLIPEEFSYTFGGGVEGGPIAYWQQVGANSGERPIDVLAEILKMPYTLTAGTYVWPFAYDKQADELTDYERRLLGSQAEFFLPDTGYLGWRAGIEPDGTWRFFIAGD